MAGHKIRAIIARSADGHQENVNKLQLQHYAASEADKQAHVEELRALGLTLTVGLQGGGTRGHSPAYSGVRAVLA